MIINDHELRTLNYSLERSNYSSVINGTQCAVVQFTRFGYPPNYVAAQLITPGIILLRFSTSDKKK